MGVDHGGVGAGRSGRRSAFRLQAPLRPAGAARRSAGSACSPTAPPTSPRTCRSASRRPGTGHPAIRRRASRRHAGSFCSTPPSATLRTRPPPARPAGMPAAPVPAAPGASAPLRPRPRRAPSMSGSGGRRRMPAGPGRGGAATSRRRSPRIAPGPATRSAPSTTRAARGTPGSRRPSAATAAPLVLAGPPDGRRRPPDLVEQPGHRAYVRCSRRPG